MPSKTGWSFNAHIGEPCQKKCNRNAEGANLPIGLMLFKNPRERQQRPMPQVQGVADQANANQEAMRQNRLVEPRLWTRRNDQQGSDHGQQCQTTRKALLLIDHKQAH